MAEPQSKQAGRSDAPLPPQRTLGLILAIVGVGIFFGLFALIPAIFLALVAAQGHTLTPSDNTFWLSPIVGILVLLVCVLAWIGRPAAIRSMFLAVSILAGVVTLIGRPELAIFHIGNTLVGGSLDSLFQGISNCLIPLRVVVLVYALWYVNRPPVKAFYESKR